MNLLAAALILLSNSVWNVIGFAITVEKRNLSPETLCRAKPPPISQFDLEAIEAFEKELEAEERALNSREDIILKHGCDVPENFDPENLLEIIVTDKNDNSRLDTAIFREVQEQHQRELSRSQIGSLITDDLVKLRHKNGELEVLNVKSTRVGRGTKVQIQLAEETRPSDIVPQKLDLEILYEDEHMIVLNKAAGMVVHPAAGNWDGTVVNALSHYLANESPYGSGEFIGDDGTIEPDIMDLVDVEEVNENDKQAMLRPGIVHRLDKGTSGVLVVAKTRATKAALSEAFKSRNVKKTYLTVTVGNPGRRVVINKPIGRHPIHRQRMRVVPDPHQRNSGGFAPKDRMLDTRSPSQAGRHAKSFVDTLRFDGKSSLVEVRIETGRTHQIRVHLQDRHTPVWGDDVYGLADWNKRLEKTHNVTRPLLHAYTLELHHPVTGDGMSFRAPMAEDFYRVAKSVWPTGEEERPEFFLQD